MNNEAKPLKLTLRNAVNAQCHECLGYYRDGKVDCENQSYSLYYWMPYRALEPKLDWIHIDPKRIGKNKRMVKVLSDDEKATLASRFANETDGQGEVSNNG